MTGIQTLDSNEMKILYKKKRDQGLTHKQALAVVREECLFLRKNHKQYKRSQPKASKSFSEAFKELVGRKK